MLNYLAYVFLNPGEEQTLFVVCLPTLAKKDKKIVWPNENVWGEIGSYKLSIISAKHDRFLFIN
jgi:hypothetical protein